MIPFPPLEPDKGPFSPTSTEIAVNVIPTANGWGPFRSTTELSAALGGTPYGGWWVRNTSGGFAFYAATKTAILRMKSDFTFEDLSKVGGYVGPDDGDLWQAERFGTQFILTNINDPVQFIDVDSGTIFADLAGSPPQAKYIETVGDFLFLAYLRVGADDFPQDWQHSKINDSEDWTITGTPGDSDRQSIPDGDEIVSIMSMPGGARVMQRRCKRRLIFTPGSAFSFQMSDIDASRGAVAPNAVVPIGGDDYVYINENGIWRGDAHMSIGGQRYDAKFFNDIDPSKLGYVQGLSDPERKIVWFRYQDQDGIYKMFGWHWHLDRFCESDTPAVLLVSAVSVGQVIDDISTVMDDMPMPVDSRIFDGGKISFGCFLDDNKAYLFAGTPAAATVETATTELTPETGSYVTGAKLKSDASSYTIQLGYSDLPDSALLWTSATTRDTRTGMCGFHNEAKFHRFRATIEADTAWSHLHGVTPFFEEAGFG